MISCTLAGRPGRDKAASLEKHNVPTPRRKRSSDGRPSEQPPSHWIWS